ncbi:MAG TPA: MBL fold metallo-hydrolase, partial [Pseudomonadales bacterium]
RRLFGHDVWADYDAVVDGVMPRAKPNLVPAGTVSRNARVTWIGQATVLIQHGGVNVLTDPVFSDRASPLNFAGPQRVAAPALRLDELPPIDAVVISHDHYDHLDAATIHQLGNGPTYFVPLGLKAWLVQEGIDATRVVELDWWQSGTLAAGRSTVTLTATPSQHVSGRTLTDRNQRLWASWALQWQDFSVWFGGDTGYNDVQFRAIGERFGRFDLGILPIGSYAPREYMKAVHLSPEDAVKVHHDIRADRSMAMHWGTFHLTAEPLFEPPMRLAAAVRTAGLGDGAIATFAIGESRAYLPVAAGPASI